MTHTQKTLEALRDNILSERTDIYVYSDGPKDPQKIEEVNEIRKFVKNFTGFNSITLVESKYNKGLSDSIISGVSSVISKKGAVIVLEDDIVTDRNFLLYMNMALEKYREHDEVWHINSWYYPIGNNKNYYFTPIMNCWGWGTWENKWNQFSKDPESLVNSFSIINKLRFDLGITAEFWSQVIMNKKSIINSWAIFWYATIFQNKGLCLTPPSPLSRNIGFDGSGTHCSELDVVFSQRFGKVDIEKIKLPKIIRKSRWVVFKTSIYLHFKRVMSIIKSFKK